MSFEMISAREADDKALTWVEKRNPEGKILGLFFVRENCGACEHMLEEVIPKANIPENMDIFLVDVNDAAELMYPPIRTPIAYFYVPNSPKIPIIREGTGPVEAVNFDFENMVKVMNGADYRETFFGDAPDEAIPEHEKM